MMRTIAVCLLLALSLACAPTSTGRPVGSPRDGISLEFYLVQIVPGPGRVERKVERTGDVVLLSPTPDLTARDMAWAEPETDRLSGAPKVLIHLTPEGMDKFATLTRANIGRELAIVLDGKIIARPLIQSEIRDGRLTIQGFESPEQARRVAGALR